METPREIGWWDQKTKEVKAARWLGYVLMGVVVIALAPIIMTLVKAAVGVLVLIGVIFVGMVLLNLAPRISRWLTLKGANFFLRLMKDEAARNPIETMQNTHLERAQDLENAADEISKLSGQISTFAEQVREHKRNFGDEGGLQALEEALALMQRAYGELEQNYKLAQKAHAEYGRKIAIAQSKWKMALTSQSIFKSLKPGGEKALLTKVLNEVAMESVETTFHQSFARLNLSLSTVRQIPHQKQETFPSGPVIEIEGEHVPEPIPVGVRR